jgi:hypothetical protein
MVRFRLFYHEPEHPHLNNAVPSDRTALKAGNPLAVWAHVAGDCAIIIRRDGDANLKKSVSSHDVDLIDYH